MCVDLHFLEENWYLVIVISVLKTKHQKSMLAARLCLPPRCYSSLGNASAAKGCEICSHISIHRRFHWLSTTSVLGQKILGWDQTGLHQSFCRSTTAYHCLHEEVHLAYGIYCRGRIAKLWQEVKMYSPEETLKAGQCPWRAAAELVGKRTADKLYNL